MNHRLLILAKEWIHLLIYKKWIKKIRKKIYSNKRKELAGILREQRLKNAFKS